MRMSPASGFGIAALLIGAFASVQAQQSAPTRPTSRPALYTEAQAKSGEALYARACASCHGRALTGGTAPPLAGPGFARSWRDPRITLDDLFFVMRTTMPPRQSNALSADERVAVFAFMLSVNGYPAGATPLATNTPALHELGVESAATAVVSAAPAEPPAFIPGAPSAAPAANGPDQNALNAAAGSSDWPVHNHDYTGSRY